MPQMAPISWLTLFIIFTLTYILFTILNYFSGVPQPQETLKSSSQKSFTSFNWAW